MSNTTAICVHVFDVADTTEHAHEELGKNFFTGEMHHTKHEQDVCSVQYVFTSVSHTIVLTTRIERSPGKEPEAQCNLFSSIMVSLQLLVFSLVV